MEDVDDDAASAEKRKKKKKKKQGALGILSATLTTVLGKQEKNSRSKSYSWKKIVEAMRPMCLQPSAVEATDGTTMPPRRLDEEIIIPGSPSASSSSSGNYTLCRYGSASNLQDLDAGEEEDPDEVFDALTGEEMIDTKVDESIAQFYKESHVASNSEI